MQFVSLGDDATIGASCHYLHVNGTGLVLDCGTDPDEDGEASLPRFKLVHERDGWYVDHALITHAHQDHMGAVPVLVQEFPHALVHMTPATAQLLELLLPASARLQRRKQREGSSTADPLFSAEEVEHYTPLFLQHTLEKAFDVTGLRAKSDVTASFYDAGHILGSAGVLLEFEEDGQERSVYYTSDTHLDSQTIIPSAAPPEGDVDVLILESTLGADEEAEKTTRRAEEERFGETIERVLGRGGIVLVPSFSLGRSQEVLALIDRFKQRGQIPRETPVYTAGMMRALADVYDKTRQSTPRLDADFKVFGVEQRRLPRSERAVQEVLSEPCILVISSGMMFERTASFALALELIEDEKNAILRVGHAIEGSPAAKLAEAVENGEEFVLLSEERGPQALNAEVQRFRFSGHSHRQDLLELATAFNPKTLLLVHGDMEAKEWMAEQLRAAMPDTDVRIPKRGEVIEV